MSNDPDPVGEVPPLDPSTQTSRVLEVILLSISPREKEVFVLVTAFTWT